MATVLGILGTDSGHHPAAALVVDGAVVAFAEEDRFTRHKGGVVPFPLQATRWALSHAGLTPADVDRVAYGWDCERYRWEMPLRFGAHHLMYRRHRRPPPAARSTARTDGWIRGFSWLAMHRPAWVRQRILQGLRDAGLRGPAPPISFHPHHRCHAASAAWLSGEERSVVLVVDGSGEDVSATAFRSSGLELEPLWSIPLPHSLGWFYSAFTEYLGFVPNLHEGKLMGLAAYGRPRDEYVRALEAILPIDGGSFRFEPSWGKYGHRSWGEHFSDRCVESFGVPRRPEDPFTDAHHDLAWAVQDRLEAAVLALARRALEDGDGVLCLAGGVAMNCKANGRVDALPGLRRLQVQPAADDAGAALGAALLASASLGDDPRAPGYAVALGPDAGDVEGALACAGLPVERPADLADAVAALIAEGRVVGWVQGRLEAGARGLGRRSILADPTRAELRDAVNARVKFREPWRPYAPSMTAAAASALLGHTRPRPHMIVADGVPAAQAQALAAVVHVDRTVRPQVVDPVEQPLYHRLLEAVGARVGVEAVLNTSFNLRGEPPVCTARDAVRTFASSGMDALVVGPFLLRKG
jgi:carbamoyltransferase